MKDTKTIITHIKLVKNIITDGFSTTYDKSNIGLEQMYVRSLEKHSNSELKELLTDLKNELATNSNRAKKELKFCIGKCQTEYIPKDGMLQMYCPSCDRVKGERPLKFNDI